MPTDYLEDIIGQAKATTAQNQVTNDTSEQKTKQEKVEDKEEQIAQEIKKKDLKELITKQDQKEDVEESELGAKTEIEKELDTTKKVEVKSYGKVKIYKVPGKSLAYYFTPTIRPSGVERKIINTLKEATTRLISIAPYKIRN
ncbi:MAG: hypothetical protein WC290_00755, partial [archaeon]